MYMDITTNGKGHYENDQGFNVDADGDPVPRCEADTKDGGVCQRSLRNGECPDVANHVPQEGVKS